MVLLNWLCPKKYLSHFIEKGAVSEPRMTLGRWVGTNPSEEGGEQSDIGKPEHWASGCHLQSVEAPEGGELSLGPSQPSVPPTPRGASSTISVSTL